VSAVEENGTLTFLHKMKNGAVDKSYGIHVAKLAGLPEEVIKKAEEILKEHENEKAKEPKKEKQIQFTMDLEDKPKDDMKEKIKKIDPLHMTPMDALNFVYELKEEIKNR